MSTFFCLVDSALLIQNSSTFLQLMAGFNLAAATIASLQNYFTKSIGEKKTKHLNDLAFIIKVNNNASRIEELVRHPSFNPEDEKTIELQNYYCSAIRSIEQRAITSDSYHSKLEPILLLAFLYCLFILFLSGTRTFFYKNYDGSLEIIFLILGVILILFGIISHFYSFRKLLYIVLYFISFAILLKWFKADKTPEELTIQYFEIIIITITAIPCFYFFSVLYIKNTMLYSKMDDLFLISLEKLNEENDQQNADLNILI